MIWATKHNRDLALTWGPCDIVIYNKYVFGLCPISGREILKPSTFPKCYIHNKPLSTTHELDVNEMAWKTPKDGGWLPGEPTINGGVELSVRHTP